MKQMKNVTLYCLCYIITAINYSLPTFVYRVKNTRFEKILEYKKYCENIKLLCFQKLFAKKY